MAKVNSTYELTTSTQIRTVSGTLTSIEVITDGANDATVIAYDVAAAGDIAAGNKLVELKVLAASNFGGRDWAYPVSFGAGLYITVSGTGASFIAEWTK